MSTRTVERVDEDLNHEILNHLYFGPNFVFWWTTLRRFSQFFVVVIVVVVVVVASFQGGPGMAADISTQHLRI